jgi:hypothetical protein
VLCTYRSVLDYSLYDLLVVRSISYSILLVSYGTQVITAGSRLNARRLKGAEIDFQSVGTNQRYHDEIRTRDDIEDKYLIVKQSQPELEPFGV